MGSKKCMYIGTIHERNGDFEYDTKVLFITGGEPDRYLDRLARHWRGDAGKYDENAGGYWCGPTLINPGTVRGVTAEDFAVLRKYLTVL